ncbi:MAG: hypothetical protein ACYCZN_12090 [Candidatus Dormibacteria bacterium]
MDEEDNVPEALETPEEAAPLAQPVPPAWSPWCDLPPPSRPLAERALMNWVEGVFRSGWPEPAETVKACYPWHSDCVATLRMLKAGLYAAYLPPVKDGEIGAAPLYRMADWDTDLERAHDRWVLSFKRCDGETCFRSKPPSYSDRAGPMAAAATDLAAEGSWGAVPPDLSLPSMEPWEVARGIASRQATAPEEETDSPPLPTAPDTESW